MRRPRLPPAVAILLLAAMPPCAAASAATPPGLLGPAYPVEARVAFHAALLHWMDSLAGLSGAGMTSGKTREAHRLDFIARHGEPSALDLDMLRRFAEVRVGFARRDAAFAPDLTLAFFETDSLEAALERARTLLEGNDMGSLRAALEHYRARYEPIWNEGRLTRKFLSRAGRDPLRERLGEFLAGVARFFAVAPGEIETPRLVFTPVRRGHGTHAQAIGRTLLIEVREGESLRDQIGPIAHENVHFLFQAIPAARRSALLDSVAMPAENRARIRRLLLEALPTAIAQGVAEGALRPRRGHLDRPWYHTEEVDGFAKRLYPLLREALHEELVLDEKLLRRMFAAYGPPPVTPREP